MSILAGLLLTTFAGCSLWAALKTKGKWLWILFGMAATLWILYIGFVICDFQKDD